MRIKGTVTDASGARLPGVNVIVQGTLTGATTDLDGKYSLEVPDLNVILTFSFIGYAQQTVAAEGKAVVNVI
jgi:CarboxypepD_reg-like domain